VTEGASETLTVTPDMIEQAARALAPYLDPTPLQYSRAFTAKTGCHVSLKIEGVQPTRAFKVRGALNKLIRMGAAEREAGLITASAGNHGLGVAHAAQVFGVPATIYVPASANQLKVEAIKRLGGHVITHGRDYQAAFQEAVRVQGVTDATFVHAFDDADVIAGQGTIAVELLEQIPDLDTVIVPVGGGGLIAGLSLYLKHKRPQVRVIGIEPAGADAMSRSLEAGSVVTLDSVQTMADGLAASAPGIRTFEIARRCVDRMIRVSEAEMLSAVRLYFEWEHLLAEPSGAAALAALLYHYAPESDERVVVILSGANMTDEVMIRALQAR